MAKPRKGRAKRNRSYCWMCKWYRLEGNGAMHVDRMLGTDKPKKHKVALKYVEDFPKFGY